MSFIARCKVLVMAIATAAAIATVAHSHRSTRTVDGVIWTRAGALHYEVYLPADYDTSGLRYPVLYFLHGLPAGPYAFQSFTWLEHALDAVHEQAILVLPQGARGDESDPEYLDHGAGHNWATAISVDLPRAIDAKFRTIASRGGRGIIGLSAGGYGAMHLAFLHLGTYAAVESWSGYFHPTDPTGTESLDLGSSARNAKANVHRQALEAQLDRLPLYIAFYVGRSDPLFVDENQQLNQELSGAGISHVFRIYPGGHSQTLWASEAPAWLTLALGHLAAPR
jgi:S-formylglutathione hydrolase FrmB